MLNVMLNPASSRYQNAVQIGIRAAVQCQYTQDRRLILKMSYLYQSLLKIRRIAALAYVLYIVQIHNVTVDHLENLERA